MLLENVQAYINKLTGITIEESINIHSTLGPGLFESVYEEVLFYKLGKRGLKVERQVSIPVYYEETKLEIGFRADLIVEDSVIVEIKSVTEIEKVHYKQLLTYLRLSEMSIGLLINFNVYLLKNGIRRVANNF